jgi:peroxiredoxin Q/BCP
MEASRFRDAYPDIKASGAEVVGISVDDHRTQCDFARQVKVAFPMIGDADRSISGRYGVVWPVFQFDRRVTFVVDGAGFVRGVFHHEFQVARHLDETLALLSTLRAS